VTKVLCHTFFGVSADPLPRPQPNWRHCLYSCSSRVPSLPPLVSPTTFPSPTAVVASGVSVLLQRNFLRRISHLRKSDTDLTEERRQFVDAGLDGVEVAIQIDWRPRQWCQTGTH